MIPQRNRREIGVARHRSETEVKPKWNWRGIEVKSERYRSWIVKSKKLEIKSKWARSEIQSEIEVKSKLIQGEAEVDSKGVRGEI